MCETELKKENSLFITDLSVVENPSNTFNVVTGQGNPVGAWTFGSMMMRMCNPTVTGLDPKEFLKEWVKLGRMTDVYVSRLIKPWIKKAREQSGEPNFGNGSGDWEVDWDGTDVNGLYRYAPFKLTAIVNRLDLRGNSAYGGLFFNAGETRFIFTHISPETGKPLFHHNMDFAQGAGSSAGEPGSVSKEDWRGMNIILEYHNVQKSKCELKAFAQLWANLSSMTLGSSQYISLLTNITNTVTSYNALPNNANKSAIARIRSNEKCFAHVSGQNDGPWSNANWEFRQMEIDATSHMFELAPLTNTPLEFHNIENNDNIIKFVPDNTGGSGQLILNWANASAIQRNRVLLGNHIMPEEVPVSNSTQDLLAIGSAQVNGEATHYLDFRENEYTQAGITNAAIAKEMRFQLSLNTCQGCHTGETKVAFTQVRPLEYGQNGDYWSTIPDYIKGTLNTNSNSPNFGKYYTDFDMRGTPFYFQLPNNAGIGNRNFTKEWNTTASHNYKLNYVAAYPFQVVSPFLTGRVYNGKINGVDNWDDDMIKPNEPDNQPNGLNNKLGDEGVKGDLYVNDPSNKFDITAIPPSDHGPFPGFSDRKNGFNDLEMRKTKLCDLIQKNCNSAPSLNDIIQEIGHIPFPLGAH